MALNFANRCSFAEHLRKFENVFTFLLDKTDGGSKNCVTLNSSLRTPEDRTRAVGEVVKSLGEELIPGIRNEVQLLDELVECVLIPLLCVILSKCCDVDVVWLFIYEVETNLR